MKLITYAIMLSCLLWAAFFSIIHVLLDWGF